MRPARASLLLAFAIVATWRVCAFFGTFEPVSDWLVWRILAIWGYALFLGAAWLCAGHFVLTRALRIADLPALETAALSLPLGVVVFVLGQYALGALHLFDAPSALLLPSILIAIGGRGVLALARALVGAAPSPPGEPLARVLLSLATLFGVAGIALVYLGAFTPDAFDYNATWCHVTVSADYARAGRIVPFPGDYARSMPHLKHLVDVWAFLVPGLGLTTRWMLVLHLEVLVFVATLSGIAATARYLLGDQVVRGTWTAFFLFPAIFVYDSNLGGSADHDVALFAAPFFLAAMRAVDRGGLGRWALAGALAGGAFLTKYQALYLVCGVGSVLLVRWAAVLAAEVRAHRPAASWRRDVALGPLALAGAGAVVVLPHFVANLVFHRNPVYPFAQDIFASSTPTTPDAALLFDSLFKDWRYRPHGTLARNVLDSLRLALTFPFEPSCSYVRDYPITGALFTLTLPFLLFVRERRRIVYAALASGCAAFAWAMVFRVDRHLQTFLPLLVATTAAVLVRAWEQGWVARAAIAPLVLLQVLWGADFVALFARDRIDSTLDMVRERDPAKRDGFRREFRALGASLPPDARILMHEYMVSLGFDRDCILDAPGMQALVRYDVPAGPRAFYDELRALGVTHLLHAANKTPSLSKKEDILFAELAHHYSGPPARFGYLEVVALPPSPPPPDGPYAVLAVGLPGYASGVYPLSAMGVLEKLPGHTVSFPSPSAPWPQDEEEQRAVIEHVDAVVLAEHAPLSAAASAAIGARFEVAESFPAFSVRLRRR